MKRHLLQLICRVLIGAVLFAQLAVSAYACPGLSSAAGMKAPLETAAAPDGDPADITMLAGQSAMDCESMAGPMDPEFSNLCAAHCRYGQQSDQAATLTVPAALLTALYSIPLAPEPFVGLRPAAAATGALAVASSPIAILHCCFRI